MVLLLLISNAYKYKIYEYSRVKRGYIFSLIDILRKYKSFHGIAIDNILSSYSKSIKNIFEIPELDTIKIYGCLKRWLIQKIM